MKNEMHYQCLTRNSFHDDDHYQLISIREEDIELIRQWRNAQIDLLRQNKEITIEE